MEFYREQRTRNKVPGTTCIIILILVILPLLAFNQEKKRNSDFPDENPSPTLGYVLAFKGQVLMFDYDKYRNYLGEYNDSILSTEGLGRIEFGFLYKKHYFGVHYGFMGTSNKTDSLLVKLHLRQFGLSYGYNIINTWHFTVRPSVSLNWNKSRLLNTPKLDAIPIQQYLNDRDLDIRFNQPYCYLGIDLSYKAYGPKLDQYTAFGIFAGYTFKITTNPIVNSRNTRLTEVPPIGMKNLSGGLYIATNLDIYH
ncbi:MAG TPA: hypothetical protein VK172_09120 [Lentimicrobium sp.]|nr:hypothetical protein [Lentimicrobium sp.]